MPCQLVCIARTPGPAAQGGTQPAKSRHLHPDRFAAVWEAEATPSPNFIGIMAPPPQIVKRGRAAPGARVGSGTFGSSNRSIMSTFATRQLRELDLNGWVSAREERVNAPPIHWWCFWVV